MEKVAIYCRVSTDEQKDSIGNQKSLLVNYCINNNLDYDLYIDEGYTGTNINRPDFLQLMYKCSLTYIEKYDILTIDKSLPIYYDKILVKNTSRLGRDMYLLQILNMLKKVGVIVEYLEDGKSTSSIDNAMDSFMLGIQTLIDRNFSEANSKKVITGMKQGALKGNINFSQILGYDRVDDYLVINKYEANIVKMIFNKYVYEDKGFRRISQELNELGFKTKTGLEFSATSIADIISNSKYYGNLTRNKMARSKLLKEKSVSIRPKEEWICTNYGDIVNGEVWTKIPPIITKELFDKAQYIRSTRSQNSRGKWKGKGVFAGKIHCSCGNNYVRNNYKDPKGNTHTYLVCYLKKTKGLKYCNSTNLTEDKILDIVNNDYINGLILRQKLKQIQGINHSISNLKSQLQTYSQLDIDALNKQLTQYKQRKSVLLDKLLDNTIDNDTYNEKAKELDTSINELQSKINEVQSNYSNINQRIECLNTKKKTIANIPINNSYTKDEIIESIKSITMNDNNMSIELNIRGISFTDTIEIK